MLEACNRIAYICGPMRGLEKYNFPAFDAAATKYREMGWTVYSPADFDREEVGCEFGDLSDECMGRIDANLTINQCMANDMGCLTCMGVNTIVLLKGWEKSTGAKPEIALGLCLGMEFITDENGETVHPAVQISLRIPA